MTKENKDSKENKSLVMSDTNTKGIVFTPPYVAKLIAQILQRTGFTRYFYTHTPTNPPFALAFEIGNFVDGGWYEKPDSTYETIQWKAYISREIYEKYQEKKRILQILEINSMLDRPYKQIMALAEILETEFELEEWEQ